MEKWQLRKQEENAGCVLLHFVVVWVSRHCCSPLFPFSQIPSLTPLFQLSGHRPPPFHSSTYVTFNQLPSLSPIVTVFVFLPTHNKTFLCLCLVGQLDEWPEWLWKTLKMNKTRAWRESPLQSESSLTFPSQVSSLFFPSHITISFLSLRLIISFTLHLLSVSGILFQDITTLLLDPKAFKDTIDLFVERYRDQNINVVAGTRHSWFRLFLVSNLFLYPLLFLFLLLLLILSQFLDPGPGET